MLGALLMCLPMHAGCALVENLDAVAAAIALAGIGVAGENHGQRDEAPGVFRPALQDGVIEKRKIVAADHFLARPVVHDFGKE